MRGACVVQTDKTQAGKQTDLKKKKGRDAVPVERAQARTETSLESGLAGPLKMQQQGAGAGFAVIR